MQWSSAGIGTEACRARGRTMVCENWVMSRILELAREVASSRPARCKDEDSETSDESGPLLVPKLARRVSGRRHH